MEHEKPQEENRDPPANSQHTVGRGSEATVDPQDKFSAARSLRRDSASRGAEELSRVQPWKHRVIRNKKSSL